MGSRRTRTALAIWVSSVSAASAVARNQLMMASTPEGARVGQVDAHGVLTFKGIPDVQLAVGDKRWTVPPLAGTWAGVRHARDFGASCSGTVLADAER